MFWHLVFVLIAIVSGFEFSYELDNCLTFQHATEIYTNIYLNRLLNMNVFEIALFVLLSKQN